MNVREKTYLAKALQSSLARTHKLQHPDLEVTAEAEAETGQGEGEGEERIEDAEDGAEAAAAEVSSPTPSARVQPTQAPAPASRLHESEICSRLVAENERLRAEV